MTTSTQTNTQEVSDPRDRLVRIQKLYGRCLDEWGAETSQYYWESVHRERKVSHLLEIIDAGGLEPYLEQFLKEATLDLMRSVRLLPYEVETDDQ